MAKFDANKFETLICYAAMLLVNVVATEAFKQGDVCLDSNSCLLLQYIHFCISEQNVERDGKRFLHRLDAVTCRSSTQPNNSA